MQNKQPFPQSVMIEGFTVWGTYMADFAVLELSGSGDADAFLILIFIFSFHVVQWYSATL